MELRNYMEKTFPEVALVPNLYKQWDTGVVFGLGKDLYQFKRKKERH